MMDDRPNKVGFDEVHSQHRTGSWLSSVSQKTLDKKEPEQVF